MPLGHTLRPSVAVVEGSLGRQLCILGLDAIQQGGWGLAPLSGPRVPTCTVSSLSQLSMLENFHDRETLMPPDLPGWEQHPGNQEQGTGGRVVVGRAVPEGEVGRPVVPWHDREQVAGRQKVSY